MKTKCMAVGRTALCLMATFYGQALMAQSNWGTKVATASESGASEIQGILDGVTTLLMAISGVVFLIGITSAGFKYKQGDQQAFKNLQGVMMGSLVILIGVGLAKILFF
ncbi:DUF4134 family protein [Arcicella sp. LKC2W]|uniref:DUF4134 family protein n=1 Tax=Arcicella sp. LKC2W TaxID=2984198 RepID=UPI002B1F0590|nr:DUF4134 family protein [Arcicella sp. LKC2W]MEA5461631.1 DUF4134 family protein [Arcicella sp. LKC2W]